MLHVKSQTKNNIKKFRNGAPCVIIKSCSIIINQQKTEMDYI